MDQLPKNFKLVPVFAIVIGVLGILAALSNAASVVGGGNKVANALVMKQSNPEVQRAQDAMMAESAALLDRWRIPNGISAVCNLLISSGLLAGGLMTNRLRRSGRRFLSKILLVSIIYDPIILIPTLMLNAENVQMQRKMSGDLMKAATGGGGPAEIGDIASIIITVSLYMGIAFMVGWVGIKIWYYVWARKKLASPDVDELFAKHGA